MFTKKNTATPVPDEVKEYDYTASILSKIKARLMGDDTQEVSTQSIKVEDVKIEDNQTLQASTSDPEILNATDVDVKEEKEPAKQELSTAINTQDRLPEETFIDNKASEEESVNNSSDNVSIINKEENQDVLNEKSTKSYESKSDVISAIETPESLTEQQTPSTQKNSAQINSSVYNATETSQADNISNIQNISIQTEIDDDILMYVSPAFIDEATYANDGKVHDLEKYTATYNESEELNDVKIEFENETSSSADAIFNNKKEQDTAQTYEIDDKLIENELAQDEEYDSDDMQTYLGGVSLDVAEKMNTTDTENTKNLDENETLESDNETKIHSKEVFENENQDYLNGHGSDTTSIQDDESKDIEKSETNNLYQSKMEQKDININNIAEKNTNNLTESKKTQNFDEFDLDAEFGDDFLITDTSLSGEGLDDLFDASETSEDEDFEQLNSKNKTQNNSSEEIEDNSLDVDLEDDFEQLAENDNTFKEKVANPQEFKQDDELDLDIDSEIDLNETNNSPERDTQTQSISKTDNVTPNSTQEDNSQFERSEQLDGFDLDDLDNSQNEDEKIQDIKIDSKDDEVDDLDLDLDLESNQDIDLEDSSSDTTDSNDFLENKKSEINELDLDIDNNEVNEDELDDLNTDEETQKNDDLDFDVQEENPETDTTDDVELDNLESDDVKDDDFEIDEENVNDEIQTQTENNHQDQSVSMEPKQVSLSDDLAEEDEDEDYLDSTELDDDEEEDETEDSIINKNKNDVYSFTKTESDLTSSISQQFDFNNFIARIVHSGVQDWMKLNLPKLVEKIVQEEIRSKIKDADLENKSN